MKKAFFLLILTLFLYPGINYCQAASSSPEDQQKLGALIENYNQWKGLGFGIAYGVAFPKKHIVDNYTVVDNILKVTAEKSVISQLLLESHYFFPLPRAFETTYKSTIEKLHEAIKTSNFDPERIKKYNDAVAFYEEMRSKRWIGLGPFVCLVPGTEEFLKAIGFGVMVGFRRGVSSNSFNMGIGYINYAEMKTLNELAADNEKLPENMTDPIKITNSGGLLLMFSFSF